MSHSDRDQRELFIEHMDAAFKAFPYHFGNWVRFYNKAIEGAEYCIRCDIPHAAGDGEHITNTAMSAVYLRFRAKLLEEPQSVSDENGEVLV